MPRNKTSLIVALDIGTSSVRALLYDSLGRIRPQREVQIKYNQRFMIGGGVEYDADRLVAQTLTALRGLLRTCSVDERRSIVAVAASCFWHALLGVDSSGRSVTPIYSWADTRSKSEAERLLTAGFDTVDYHRRTGCYVHSCYWPAKIAWLRSTQPHVADKVRTWLSFSDYLALKVAGGVPTTSFSMASATGLLNQQTGDWDHKTLDLLAVKRDSLPDIAGVDDTFKAADMAKLPQLSNVPWLPAYGDGACSNIGSGGVDTTRIVVNISTSGAIRVLTETPGLSGSGGLFQYRMDRERWVIGGAVSNGGNVYAWLSGAMRLPDASSLDTALLKAVPDGHGLTVLPFWAGERSPGWHASASAALTGLNLSTTPLDLAQASLEAIAYSLRTLRDELLCAFPSATQVIVSGGAVEHSRYMPQMLASVFETPVRRSLDPEPSGRGAALAVSERLGLIDSLASSQDRLSRPIHPDQAAAKAYSSGYDRYKALYDKLMGTPAG